MFQILYYMYFRHNITVHSRYCTMYMFWSIKVTQNTYHCVWKNQYLSGKIMEMFLKNEGILKSFPCSASVVTQ